MGKSEGKNAKPANVEPALKALPAKSFCSVAAKRRTFLQYCNVRPACVVFIYPLVYIRLYPLVYIRLCASIYRTNKYDTLAAEDPKQHWGGTGAIEIQEQEP